MNPVIDLRKKVAAPEPQQPVPKEAAVEAALPEPASPPSPPVSTPTSQEISWESSLSYIPSKQSAWYAFGICGVSAVAIWILLHDVLFGTILALAGFVILLRAHARRQSISISVNRSGISVGQETYYYHELKSFWLDYRPPHTKDLSIEFKKTFRAPIRMPIETVNPLEIRTIMVQYIPEKEHEVSFLDQIIRLLGF